MQLIRDTLEALVRVLQEKVLGNKECVGEHHENPDKEEDKAVLPGRVSVPELLVHL